MISPVRFGTIIIPKSAIPKGQESFVVMQIKQCSPPVPESKQPKSCYLYCGTNENVVSSTLLNKNITHLLMSETSLDDAFQLVKERGDFFKLV